MQNVNIPALSGEISMALWAEYTGSSAKRVAKFADDNDPYDASLKLPDRDHTANLTVNAMVGFPPLNEGGHYTPGNIYMQHLKAVFPKIVQTDGVPVFAVTEKKLQGEPTSTSAQKSSPFRFLGGMAWLTATNNSKYLAIKVKMFVGSPDVVVKSKSVTNTKPSSKIKIESKSKEGKENDGGKSLPKRVFDEIREWLPDVGFERSSATQTSSRGTSRTIGQMSQEREWTLLLELPEPEPQFEPITLKYGFLHEVFFDTNKSSNLDRYPHPKTKSDQIKDLQRFMDDMLYRYGKEKIKRITVRGHASRLGDTEPNINLSQKRAQYVADLIRRLYHLKIPKDGVVPRGEPVTEGNDKDNSWKERKVWVDVEVIHTTNMKQRKK